MVTLDHDKFVDHLVSKLNVEFDIPIANEEQEAQLLRWGVQQVAEYIPESLLELMVDAADGISADEKRRLVDVMTGLLSDLVDIPGMPEWMEQRIVEPALRSILNGVLDYALPGNLLV